MLTTREMIPSLVDIPVDLIDSICSHLVLSDILTFKQVSKELYRKLDILKIGTDSVVGCKDGFATRRQVRKLTSADRIYIMYVEHDAFEYLKSRRTLSHLQELHLKTDFDGSREERYQEMCIEFLILADDYPSIRKLVLFDKDGLTFGSYVYDFIWKTGNLGHFDQFIETGCLDVDHPCDGRNVTLLHLAARFGITELATRLIEHGANVNAKDIDGYSPLHFCMHGPCIGVARLLIEHGADANAKTNQGTTPLHSCVRYSAMTLRQAMASKATGIALTAKDGSKSFEAARLLIEHGADVNAKNCDGYSPLHLCHRVSSAELARLLISHGAQD